MHIACDNYQYVLGSIHGFFLVVVKLKVWHFAPCPKLAASVLNTDTEYWCI